MALYRPIQIDGDEDLKVLMKKLYRFNEDLRNTVSELDIEDNCPGVLDKIDERNKMMRTIQFDSDHLQIQFDDLETNTTTSLRQSEDAINLLVSRGSVVDTLITRLDVFKESIYLKSKQIEIDADNMKLDKIGNAIFSGDITGGSIYIADGKFWVNENGDCYIDDELITETLNPTDGIFAANLEVYNDEEYIINITGTINSGEAYISNDLSCRQATQHSDGKLKRHIKKLDAAVCADIVRQLQPKTFRFAGSGTSEIGFIAQDIYRTQSDMRLDLPLVGRNGKYLEVPYASYVTQIAGTIQDNQRRIDGLKKEVRKWHTSTVR